MPNFAISSLAFAIYAFSASSFDIPKIIMDEYE